MIDTLKRFTNESLFDATSALLSKLNIQFDRETAEPIDVADLYDGVMPQYLKDALTCISNTYFIGIVNDDSLKGQKNSKSLDSVAETMEHGGKYDGMFIFACDAKVDANLTRTASSALTRAFNRIASANPVILFIRQGNNLSLATCERMEYSAEWRQGGGEKLGKVNILRNINCACPHRGHVDILCSLADEAFITFESLYKHWLSIFSNELLTKKFYSELSDWYAWAVQVVKFPNDLRTNEDDARYNHESCIRLITRLIFVWFLKQKKLIPEEFFDESYIREHFIENFNPHDRQDIFYDAEQSKYYRLILQNLFFAMLNCPIVAEGKDTPNNRRFRKTITGYYKNTDYNVNNLMRYEGDFKEGGAKEFVKLANNNVPFLNGGLFDCLDDKPRMMYYDGFSERKESLEQLYFPDYLFFGDEVGKGIDLSQWYDDKKKKCVSARGIIDILKRYSFTIEENTPLDQEVSLDPELLGKVFENLLASFNPETKTSARKQTGSFYTPREIVQYMVDESLVAHLKRMCGDELEPQYRDLVSYATDDVALTEGQRKSILNALYNCRVLDPACGSGAFPMGVLQQMVHVLKRIDPSNEMWNDMVVNIAIEDAKRELKKAANNEQERQKVEENRKARLDDIESAFNQSINDPDYARKLYLIEHCIYGVDIQPIATQISKLRFFISLVVDQKPTDDPKSNFGIRPLPNLESKFVTANTLIPLDRSRDLFTSSAEVKYYEDLLHELNHRIFLAKRNKDKQELRQRMSDTRRMMALVMQNEGFIGNDGFNQLSEWNMFDQNASASFFDPEWMFGVKDGFDVVIGNPPYVQLQSNKGTVGKMYQNKGYTAFFKMGDLYCLFIEKGYKLLKNDGILSFINPNTWLQSISFAPIRKFITTNMAWHQVLVTSKVFDATVDTHCLLLSKSKRICDCSVYTMSKFNGVSLLHVLPYEYFNKRENAINIVSSPIVTMLASRLIENNHTVGDYCRVVNGVKPFSKGRGTPVQTEEIVKTHPYVKEGERPADNWSPLMRGSLMYRYENRWDNNYWILYGPNLAEPRDPSIFSAPHKIIVRQTGDSIIATTISGGIICRDNLHVCVPLDSRTNLNFILGVMNSKLTDFLYSFINPEKGEALAQVKKAFVEQLSIPIINNEAKEERKRMVENLVCSVLSKKKQRVSTFDEESEIDHLIYHLYDLTYDEVLIIDPDTPITREEYEAYESDK